MRGEEYDPVTGEYVNVPDPPVMDLSQNTSSLPPAALPAPPFDLVTPSPPPVTQSGFGGSAWTNLFNSVFGAFNSTQQQAVRQAQASTSTLTQAEAALLRAGSYLAKPLVKVGGITLNAGVVALGAGGILLLASRKRSTATKRR